MSVRDRVLEPPLTGFDFPMARGDSASPGSILIGGDVYRD